MKRTGLHDLALSEAMDLWGDLTEALHGVSGFGGDTAELYAYRFGHESPMAYLNHESDAARETALARAAVLHDLLTRFAERHNCRIWIGAGRTTKGRALGPWLRDEPFVHRAHVRVEALP